ncbi:hypothetical protein ACLB2K_016480 [Fragaria x ananassa]
MDPLPSLNKTYSLALRHEKQAAVATGKVASSSELAAAFHVASQAVESTAAYVRKTEQSTNTEEKIRWEKCDHTNHTIKNCKAHLRCTYCNWKGHTYDNCRRRKAAMNGEGTNQVTSNHVAAVCDAQAGARTNAGFPFSKEDCARLIELWHQTRTGSSNQAGNISNYEELLGKVAILANNCCETLTWLIDSGASNHIICNTQFFTNMWPPINYTVKLSSSSYAAMTHIGTIMFSTCFKLENVLCVPSFYLNLIFVSKLARDSFFVTIFLRKFMSYMTFDRGG